MVDGGGFNYGAHVAIRMGLKVAAITRLAKDDFHVVDALTQLGVDVYATATSTSTNIRLEYPTTNVDERTLYCTNFAGAFTPAQVEALQAQAFLINASTRDEVNLEVIEELINDSVDLVHFFLNLHAERSRSMTEKQCVTAFDFAQAEDFY